MKKSFTIYFMLLFISYIGGNIFAQYETKLIPNDGDIDDEFGRAIDIYGDYAVVGAHMDDDNGDNSGSAYIFKRNGFHTWVQQQKLLASDGAEGDYFGNTVAIWGDYVIVGASEVPGSGTAAGAVYVFKRDGETWSEQTILTASDGNSIDRFGNAVDLFENYAIIGAYYDSPVASYSGSAYIFRRDGEVWTEEDKIYPSDGALEDFFGNSVSISGEYAIVGAYHDDDLGSYSGSAYIFQQSGTTWSQVIKLTETGGSSVNFFGQSVSIQGDSIAIVGSPNGDGRFGQTGACYIYKIITGTWTEVDKIYRTNGGGGGSFGYSVQIDGEYIIGGDYSDNVNGFVSGSATVFHFDGTDWIEEFQQILPSDGAPEDYFGQSVAISEGFGLCAAHKDDPFGSNSGSVYIYDLLFQTPVIDTVKDVPNDQGGLASVIWQATNIDTNVNELTHYSIWRALPQGTQPTGSLVIGSDISFDFNEPAYRMLSFNGDSFAWEWVANQAAHKFENYSYTAPTLYDSSSTTDGKHYFLVSAHTSDPNIFYDSDADSGYSVDNLAPLPPEAFYANLNGAEVKLGWEANTEPDLRDYNIYRSDTPVGDELTLIGTTTDTIFIDSSPLTGTSYYYIQAFDIHENGSEYSEAIVDVVLSANIKIYLEGPYLAGSMSTDLNTFGFIPPSQPFDITPWDYSGTETVGTIPSGVVDWLLVELRSDETTMVARRAGFLKSDGSIVDLDGVSLLNFPSVSNGDYYVIVYQRNHMPIMTAGLLTLSETPSLYDFTTAQTQAYGTDAMKDLGGGTFGMYTGDTDGSGTVNAADRSNTWNDRNNTGYYGSDLDLSGTVNAADRSIVWNNRNLSTQVPVLAEKKVTNKIINRRKDNE